MVRGEGVGMKKPRGRGRTVITKGKRSDGTNQEERSGMKKQRGEGRTDRIKRKEKEERGRIECEG